MKDFERIDRIEREQYFIQQILSKILDIQIQLNDVFKDYLKKIK